MTHKPLKAPFPWFGGKSRVSGLVWERFGKVSNYVEPFFGSGAVLLGRPDWRPGVRLIETVNDKDAYLCNFWRAIKHAPDEVAHHADWPVNEADLHARHKWLVEHAGSRVKLLESDPDAFCAKSAGWWWWGISAWIGGKWCDGSLHKQKPAVGVNSQRGRKSPKTSSHQDLHQRLKSVDVLCGDWARVLTSSVIAPGSKPTAVFFDPPYDTGHGLYREGAPTAQQVGAWAVEHGDDPSLRIALCGYEGDHDALDAAGWDKVAWKAQGGYGSRSGNDNCTKERIWFSPHCLTGAQGRLF